MEIHGTCEAGFGAVRDAFERNFAEGLEVGAAAAVTFEGEPVVDIWAGDADPYGTPWERDTIVNVYSTTKTMAATAMLALADRGELDFDAPVCEYWPEFAQNGKQGVLVSHVMSHTAGLPGFVPPVTAADLYDLDAVAERLAAAELWFEFSRCWPAAAKSMACGSCPRPGRARASKSRPTASTRCCCCICATAWGSLAGSTAG